MVGNNYSTLARKNILEYLQENRNQGISALDIQKHLEEIGHPVNKTTVYRYLDKLTKDGLLMKYVSEKGNQTVYQYVEEDSHCENHLHLKCVLCGAIAHLDCTYMAELQEHISSEHGFSIECKNSVLYGLCQECSSKQSSFI